MSVGAGDIMTLDSMTSFADEEKLARFSVFFRIQKVCAEMMLADLIPQYPCDMVLPILTKPV